MNLNMQESHHELETPDIETSSDQYARRFAGEAGAYFLDRQTQITLDLIQPYHNARILDVGGGHAQLAVPMVAKGLDVTVVGSAKSCRHRLDRFLGPDDFSYHTCNLLTLPFEDRQFDIVVGFRLLTHVHAWRQLIREMCRVAKIAVIVDYPDQRSFNIFYRLLFPIKKALEGDTRTYVLFSRKQITDAFMENGLGNHFLRPQFFFPMVLHRKMKSLAVSKMMEKSCRKLGLTALFGSPIIVKACR
jgi:ubiquinone/menaquinone biosynthesis C-methylase UbiE